MKKIFFIVCSIMSAQVLIAQEPADALRFSWTVPSGTARHQAIGGAMGSLGGDITATFINPAGLAFYRTGDLVFSPMYRFGKSKGSYLGRTENDQYSRFNWGTTGAVLGSGSETGKSKNVAISIAYNRSADFNNNILYRGANNTSSISNKYVNELNKVSNKNDQDQITQGFPYGSSLAFNTYWLDPVYDASGNVTHFTSKAPLSTGLLQEQTVNTKGGIDEFAFAGAVQVSDKLFFGGTFGVPVLHFERNSLFKEADATNDPNNNFDFAEVNESLSTKGVGLNLKAGLIYKPKEFIRLGLAVHSPSIYSLTDTYEASITTDVEDPSLGVLTDYSTDYNSGNPSVFKYMLLTPYRVIGSASYVLREIQDVTKQRGFITADVEYVNYKASSFHPPSDDEIVMADADKEYLKSLNRAIDNAYKGTFNFRVGGELKFNIIMVRAGAAYYGNPYKNINGEKGSRLNLSGGLGYRHKGIFIDLTYVHAMQKDVHFPYRLEDKNLYSGANINTTAGNVLATVGFKF